MYGRRCRGGRGYVSNNSFMMGMVASQPLPDGPGRGGFYNLGYWNFNGGFGRGQGRYFPHPLRNGDLFMEAGRLAAEYLVAKGMLPPNALLPKFQNGGFRNEFGEFQEFKQQDGGYITAGNKHNLRGRKETGSFSNYHSDRAQENGKSGSISSRSRASSDKEADDDALSVHYDEQLTTNDDEQNNKVNLALKSDGKGNLPSEAVADPHQLVTDSAVTGKDCEQLTNMEAEKIFDGFGNNNVDDGEIESKNDEAAGQHSPNEESIIQLNQMEATPASQKGNELLQLCNLAKAPTRTRSPRSRVSKGGQCTTVEEECNSAGTSTGLVVAKSIESDASDRSLVDTPMEQTPLLDGHTSSETPVAPELILVDDVVGSSEPNTVIDQNIELDSTTKKIMSMDKSVQSLGKAILLDHDGSKEGTKCLESLSFPGRSFAYSDESCQGPMRSKGLDSVDEFMARERGEKRVLDENIVGGSFKKLKACPPSMISQVDEYPHRSNLITEGSTMIESTSQTKNLMIIGQESSSHISEFTSLGDENSVEYAEDKQMIDRSFKICDLNLMEGSHLDGNHDRNQMMFSSSISEIRKELLSIDGGLPIGDGNTMSQDYNTTAADGKELEIFILGTDLDNDRAFSPGQKREDAVHTAVESVTSQPRGSSDGTDVQDGFGLMISELLETEIPNCSSSVPGDKNSLHDDRGLHDDQAMLPEDDPTFMTLGEIPIGFWESPKPEIGKPI